jgi:hypothetical protein
MRRRGRAAVSKGASSASVQVRGDVTFVRFGDAGLGHGGVGTDLAGMPDPSHEVIRVCSAGRAPRGGYFGYFCDRGGHLWKVAAAAGQEASIAE